MPEHKKLRVAVIGCGMIHVEHMQGYAELKDKVEIVAAVDRKRECLEAVRDKWGLPENALFADWDTMLAEVRPDAVSVCRIMSIFPPRWMRSPPAAMFTVKNRSA